MLRNVEMKAEAKAAADAKNAQVATANAVDPTGRKKTEIEQNKLWLKVQGRRHSEVQGALVHEAPHRGPDC